MAKKTPEQKIAEAKAKKNAREKAKKNSTLENEKNSVTTGGSDSDVKQNASDPNFQKPPISDIAVKHTDGYWYKNGEKITHAGTINLLENKTSWKPGESGNESGRPKGVKNRGTILRELLSLDLQNEKGFVKNPLDPSEERITVEKAIMAALINKALRGDVRAIQEIQDTQFGKLKDRALVNIVPTVIKDDIPDDD